MVKVHLKPVLGATVDDSDQLKWTHYPIIYFSTSPGSRGPKSPEIDVEQEVHQLLRKLPTGSS